MDHHFLLLAEVRQAEVTRDLPRRTLAARLVCRRRILGILPFGAPCEPNGPAS